MALATETADITQLRITGAWNRPTQREFFALIPSEAWQSCREAWRHASTRANDKYSLQLAFHY